ncbi:MAG: thiamine-monophosphate kinase [Symbiopectobacterium sp.]|uniref:thiamine-monophosphate kinase n=1 Tax=Symbiopectobacterium sp. TaxID=2952789 RepID=UPI0039E81CB4
MVYGEFDLIVRYFNRANAYKAGNPRRDVELGTGDDCALLSVAEKQLLAVSTDALVSWVHFLPTIDPADLGYKSLAVNLSDLAAMGADPAWLSLAITLPEINSAWLAAYSDSLFTLLDYYGMQLIGGDTTRGPLSLTLTIHGLVPAGRALTRAGARIQLDAIPYSSAMMQHVEPDQALRWALSGGEDYELCFTVPEINRGAIDMALGQLGVGYTCIGQIAPSSEGLRFFRGDNAVELNWKGYDHFSQ